MKQNNDLDLKADATFYYVNLPYSELETAFNTTNTPNGVPISEDERKVLEIIWATRFSIEPFRYSLWRNCPEYFEMLFGSDEREKLNKAFDLYQSSKLVDMGDFKNFCDCELVNL